MIHPQDNVIVNSSYLHNVLHYRPHSANGQPVEPLRKVLARLAPPVRAALEHVHVRPCDVDAHVRQVQVRDARVHVVEQCICRESGASEPEGRGGGRAMCRLTGGAQAVEEAEPRLRPGEEVWQVFEELLEICSVRRFVSRGSRRGGQ